MQNFLKANNFYVQYKNKKDGVFTDIKGSAVFPFTWGELLDERLDEAALTIVNDTVEHYDPLTEFKITSKKPGYTEVKSTASQRIMLSPNTSTTIHFYPEQTYTLTVDAPSTDYTIVAKTTQGLNGGRSVSCTYRHYEQGGKLYIHITAKNSSTGIALTPLTATMDFAVTFKNIPLDEGWTKHFIVARDDSVRNPYTKKYKHTLYLLERTKLLDGILCSSITFTNDKGRIYASEKDVKEVSPENILTGDRPSIEKPYIDYIRKMPSVAFAGALKLPSINELITYKVGEEDHNVMTDTTVRYGLGFDYVIAKEEVKGETRQSYIVVEDGNNEYQYLNFKCESESDLDKSITLTDIPNTNLTIKYFIVAKYGSQATTFALKYEILVVTNRNPLKKYTITDCVNRVLELAEPIMLEYRGKNNITYTLEAPRFKFNEAQAKKYEKILAPEFTMTQCTLREQLKVIGSFIHGEPRLTENNEIYFEEYGREDKSPLEDKPFVYSGKTTSINQYATEVRSNAQNLVNSLGYAQGTVLDPGGNAYRSLRTESVYARIDDNNGIIQTLYPIYSIERLECKLLDEKGNNLLGVAANITPYVFEETIYNSTLSSYKESYLSSKAFALYYTHGAKNVKGLFFMLENAVDTSNFSKYAIINILSRCNTGKSKKELDELLKGGTTAGHPEQLAFNIVYKPIYPTMVTHGKSLYVPGKESFTKIYNQSENLIETQYFGENLKGVAARLGNVECERTYMLTSLDDIPRTGDMIDGFAISAASVEVQPFIIKCTVGLTKDFNRISEYVGVSSVKRMYEISERQVQQRNILLHNTLVIGKKPDGYDTKSCVFHSTNALRELFNGENTVGRKSIACAKGYSKSGAESASVALPVIASAFGNVMTFYFSYKDNYSAGTSSDYERGEDGVIGHWLNDVRYTDYYGRLYSLSFGLYSAGEITTDPYKLPSVEWTPKENDVHGSFLVRKDSREAISVTAELEIKTEFEDIIIGSALARLCRYVTDQSATVKMYLITDERDRVGKFDKKFISQHNAIDITGLLIPDDEPAEHIVANTNDGSFTITDFTVETSGYGWVICTASAPVAESVEDEDGNITTQKIENGYDILLASNRPVEPRKYIFGGDAMRNLDFYILPE